MRKKRKARRSSCGYGYCFHGSFLSKEKAWAKARKIKGAFVVSRVPWHSNNRRHIVMKPRAAPRARREKVPF